MALQTWLDVKRKIRFRLRDRNAARPVIRTPELERQMEASLRTIGDDLTPRTIAPAALNFTLGGWKYALPASTISSVSRVLMVGANRLITKKVSPNDLYELRSASINVANGTPLVFAVEEGGDNTFNLLVHSPPAAFYLGPVDLVYSEVSFGVDLDANNFPMDEESTEAFVLHVAIALLAAIPLDQKALLQIDPAVIDQWRAEYRDAHRGAVERLGFLRRRSGTLRRRW